MSVLTLTPEQIEELAVLRKARRAAIKENWAASRKRTAQIKKMKGALTDAEGPMTIPELAGATGIAGPDVLWCVTAMKKYGLIGERDNDGGYFRYALETGAAVPEEADDE